MLVAVQSFGSIWTERRASRDVDGANCVRRPAFYNTTGVMSGSKLRNRSCVYGYVRLDECSGFHPSSANRVIHRVYESEGVSVWSGRNKLFLRQLMPAGTRPDVYLFRIGSSEIGWIDRSGSWTCNGAEVVSFSEGNGQQEALLILPAFGWIRSERGTFCVDPRRERPWTAVLSCAAK
ncbi:MAG TPA: hypothetical protein VKY31_16395 [Terriglobia bacterium]|nr:hypothetical protein [Terriglobia bacterium]